jgi:hypothetical protein
MRRGAAALLVCCLAAGCRRDPLGEYRATCSKLRDEDALRPGLSLDDCAGELKSRADLADPARRAEELVDRIARLVVEGSGKPTRLELRDALADLKELGRPAEAPALLRLRSSTDAELRIALARVLVGICADDCARRRFDCIVPALLEGTGEERPPEVRVESEKALARCTGERIGDDRAAWRAWWARSDGAGTAQQAIERAAAR